MVCRRGLRSVSLLCRQGCRSITLFKSLCIIRPVVFQVADLASNLVSNLVPILESNLHLYVTLAGRIDPYLPVQTGAVAYQYPVCPYLRAQAVPASYSCPGPGERYFCVGSLCCLCLALLCLCLESLFRLYPALRCLCPGSLFRLYPALRCLCPGNLFRLYPALLDLCPGNLFRLYPALRRLYCLCRPSVHAASSCPCVQIPGRMGPCLCPGSPDRIRPDLYLAGPGCFDSDPGRTGNMGPVPRNCPAVPVGSLYPFVVRRPFRVPILDRRRDPGRLRPDRQTPRRPKP